MGIVTNGALLRSGVVGDHDLRLLRGPARHLFMAKSAKLCRIGWDGQLQVIRVIGPGGRVHKHAARISPAGRAMADLALDDLSDINAVVDAFRPFREALRVARLAI
jgi:hypothetical protein